MTKRISIIGSNVSATVVPGWNDYELMQFERAYLEEGVIEGVGTSFAVSQRGAGANMSVDVAAGRALIEITNTNVAHGKTYKVHFDSDAVENIVVTAADTTNPRIDRIVLRVDVSQNPNGSSSNIAIIENLAGTPAGSPSAPAEPANAITLALVSVPASDTQITDNQITDMRPFTQVKDGVLKKIMRQGFLNSFGTVGGTGNAITISLDPKIASYTDKFTLFFKATNNNTGATTVAIDGLAAKTIKKHNNIDLASNDIKAGMTFGITYDSTDDVFKLITVPGNTPDGQEIGSMKFWPAKAAPPTWLFCYGQALSRTTYSLLFNVLVPNLGTFTVTIASPAVFTLNNHGLVEGDPVYFTTTGALPTGLSANTIYYVIAAGLGTNDFRVSTTRGGSAVNTSGSQSGTHSLFHCPYGLGDGSTTFNVPDTRGRNAVSPDNLGGTNASRITTANGKGLGGSAGADIINIDHTHQTPTGACGTQSGGCQVTGAGSAPAYTGGMLSNANPNIMNPYITIPMIIKYA